MSSLRKATIGNAIVALLFFASVAAWKWTDNRWFYDELVGAVRDAERVWVCALVDAHRVESCRPIDKRRVLAAIVDGEPALPPSQVGVAQEGVLRAEVKTQAAREFRCFQLIEFNTTQRSIYASEIKTDSGCSKLLQYKIGTAFISGNIIEVVN